MIPQKTLNNGVKIPILGLGTWELGESCCDAVKTALKLGYTHIDTAEGYKNEEEIGKAILGVKRENLFITTKSRLWTAQSSKDVVKLCENALKRLGIDYIDLFLLHWPKKEMNMVEIFTGFKELYENKKIRAIGVSNCTINHLKDFLKICKKFKLPLSVNQIEFHPYLYQKELLDFCKKNNIAVTAYSPLARGEIIKDKIIIELAKKYKKTASQITLRWILEKGLIVIPKASSEKHLKENLGIFDFSIKKEDTLKIDKMNINKRIINPDFAEFDY